MTTNLTTRMVRTGATVLFSAMLKLGLTQSSITAHVGAGPSTVDVNGSEIINLVDPYIKPITQFTAGIQYEKAISRQLALLTGAQYTTRGFSMREEFNIGIFGIDVPIGAEVQTKLNYLEAPVMLKYYFTESGVSPYIKAGASGAYALDGKITPKLNAIIPWSLPTIPLNLDDEIYNRFDVSAVVGAGVSVPVSNAGALQFDLTYRHSLNDMFHDNLTDIRIKSNGFSAGIGYTIRF
ncbi:MAG TPA: porin family protein [Saprospiraceae bacterium]|jgi:opacity protein-like surface antigen